MKQKILLIGDEEAGSSVLLATYLGKRIYSPGIIYGLNAREIEGKIELDKSFIKLSSGIVDEINVMKVDYPASDKMKDLWKKEGRECLEEYEIAYRNTFNLKMKVIDDFCRENGIEIYVFYSHKGINVGVLEEIEKIKNGGFEIFLDLGFETYPFCPIELQDIPAQKINDCFKRYKIGTLDESSFRHYEGWGRDNAGGVFLGKRLMEKGIKLNFFTNGFGHSAWQILLLEYFDLISAEGTRENCPNNLLVSSKQMINGVVFEGSGGENFFESSYRDRSVRDLEKELQVFLK